MRLNARGPNTSDTVTYMVLNSLVLLFNSCIGGTSTALYKKNVTAALTGCSYVLLELHPRLGCLKHNITRFVYTSTYNVIFGGQTIEQGDETLLYLPLDKHPDHYSRTKSMAEQSVLEANGKPTSSGAVLHMCAVRLAAVYGPGEQRHIPRIVVYKTAITHTFSIHKAQEQLGYQPTIQNDISQAASPVLRMRLKTEVYCISAIHWAV